MRRILTAMTLTAALTACGGGSGGGDGDADIEAAPPVGATGIGGAPADDGVGATPAAGSADIGGPPADDGSATVTVSGDTEGLVVDENAGVTGSGSGGPVDIVIENGGDLSDEVVTDELLQARRTILGTWDFVDPGTGCTDTLRFDGDGRFEARSLDEIRSGDYRVYLDGEGPGALSLELYFEEDNQLPDCEGDNTSSAGALFDSYLGFRSADTLRLSEAPGGFGDFVDFERRNR